MAAQLKHLEDAYESQMNVYRYAYGLDCVPLNDVSGIR